MKNRMAMTTATVAALMLLSGCGGDAASENNQSATPANEAMPDGGNLVPSAGAPESAPKADLEVEAKAAPKAESTSESSSEARAKTQAAPETAPRPTPKVEPKAAPKVEPKPAEKTPATPACAPEHRALGHC